MLANIAALPRKSRNPGRSALLTAVSSVAASMFAIVFALTASAASEKETGSVRLPEGVYPTSYKIFVEPHADDGKFFGSESINMEVNKPVDKIVLNSNGIKLTDATCQFDGALHPIKVKFHYQPKLQQVSFYLPRTINKGRCTLSLGFEGVMSDKLKGFFRSKFEDSSGKQHWLAGTQMEPTDARRMFPCFDEPALKATFKITASVEPGDTAISNSPILAETIDSKTHRKIVSFEETPKMSTYLVALVAGKLVGSKTVVSEGVPVRVWCTPGKEKLTAFSQELAGKLLTYYKGYFDVAYPAKKLDLIAIPDFGYGAMENLGAATFREDTLLVDGKDGSLDAKQLVAINLAHEMAHMWFGDLVTMKWWDDLWLNEAFAEWMSTKAVDELKPDWHYWNVFALERDQSMLSDSLKATRPIHENVSNPDQIEQLFDEITYQKGASVLRMAERFVGETDFRNGIRRYIKAHEFANATGDDLWSAIAIASGKDVPTMMHGWIYQEGFPLVTVDATDGKLALTQQRFVFQRGSKTEDKTSWEIPVEMRDLENKNGAEQKIIVTNKVADIDVAQPLVNAGGEGYYRVKYSPEALKVIASDLDQMTALERAAALSDQFYLALSGQITVKDYLNFTAAFKNEHDPTVTAVLCEEFKQLDLMVDDASYSTFASFVRDRLSHAKGTIDFSSSSDSEEVRKQKAEVMLAMGTIGQDKATISEARAIAKRIFAHDPSLKINADYLDPIIKIVAYNGDLDDYAKIEELWQQAKTPERQGSALMALGVFRDPELIHRTLKMCLSDKVQRQDGTNLIASVMETRAGRGIAWDFFRKHILHIAWHFSSDRLYNIVMAMNALSTEKQLSQVQAFFTKHPVPSQSRGISKIIEAIEVRVAFQHRSGNQVRTWLAINANSSQILSDVRPARLDTHTIHLSQGNPPSF